MGQVVSVQGFAEDSGIVTRRTGLKNLAPTGTHLKGELT
jgi:hypothetical protein